MTLLTNGERPTRQGYLNASERLATYGPIQDPAGIFRRWLQIEMRARDRTGGPAISKVLKVSKRWPTQLFLPGKVMQFDYFIGIDVSKATLDFAVAKANQVLFHQQVSNDKKGITEFLKVLRQQTKATMGQCLFCLEHTGMYNNPLLKALHQLSTNIWVERAVHIQESMGMTRGKTDRAGGPASRCQTHCFVCLQKPRRGSLVDPTTYRNRPIGRLAAAID